MGIRHLETFVCSELPNGYFRINIENEIRNYYNNQPQGPNPPVAPVIVIDLMALYRPVSQADLPGLLCGGRFNVAAQLLDEFFGKLTALGAKLVFFYDGPVQDTKYDTWISRQDEKYHKMMDIIQSVDQGSDIAWLVKRYRNIIPNNTSYPVKQVAKRHGQLVISVAKECDQELANYANQVQALAIISNDTDFMIYKGFWRYWSAKDINFRTLSTMEYNRVALVRFLGLSFKQMRLLATLGGNDVIQYDEVRHFHSKVCKDRRKFPMLAEFVRQQPQVEALQQEKPLRGLLTHIFGGPAVNPDLMERFRASLAFYDTAYQVVDMNPSRDPVIDILLALDNTFMYQVWKGCPVNVTAFFVDMRVNEFGSQYPQLVIPVVARQAGIVLYHRQMLCDSTHCTIVIKLNHDAGHSFQSVPIQYPERITPPPLVDLLSRQQDIRASLLETKLKLYCWIASETLDHHRLQPVPEQLRATVVTLYYLVENKVLNLLEADILLQMAHDVAFETYPIQNVQYPKKLHSRPFRIAFMYQKIYNHFSKALVLLGVEEESFTYFDGVLFHDLYAKWHKQCGSLDQISSWRIYDGLVE